MKIITLNTHSLIEVEYEKKLLEFVEVIQKEEPDIVALQEVNQTATSIAYPSVFLDGYVRCKECDVVIRKDNHAARLVEFLRSKGLKYYWTWIPVKLGYSIYDEGIALLSREAILETQHFPTSKTQDYYNWKSRKALGIRTGHDGGSWFYCVHMGWWNDEEEPFKNQWDEIEKMLKEKSGHVWVMGDFNSPAQVRGEGYDYVESFGWKDSYVCATKKDYGNTVEKVIDGWKPDEVDTTGMRIDMIWSRKKENVKSSQVICDGRTYPVVSDHYGVIIVVEGEKEDE